MVDEIYDVVFAMKSRGEDFFGIGISFNLVLLLGLNLRFLRLTAFVTINKCLKLALSVTNLQCVRAKRPRKLGQLLLA